jgi:hypothetical protein
VGGYIDSAIPRTKIALRGDFGNGTDVPDRAEFFYAKCGCFRPLLDPDAAGPALPETRIKFQDISARLEARLNERTALFVEVPFRFLNPEDRKSVV